MKTILITGSSRGIGKAIATLAHKQGYKVIVHGKSGSEELNKTQQELDGSLKVVFDVADKQATHEAVANILNEVGAIDVLVNNAGIARNFLKDIAEVDDDKAIEEYRTNVLGTLHVTQAVLPKMLEQQKGSVINIASIKGQYNLATTSTLTFATTKAGIISLTKALAKTYGDKGIRFNTVSPGYVETDLIAQFTDDMRERLYKQNPVGRVCWPSEVAALVTFLCSNQAAFINGEQICIDGGRRDFFWS